MFGLFETGLQFLYWGNIVMIVIGLILIFFGIAKKMEPLLLVPIGFGILLVNLPIGGLMDYEVDLRSQIGQSDKVISVEITDGQWVQEGDTLFILETGKITAPVSGRVTDVDVVAGQTLSSDSQLGVLTTNVKSDVPATPIGLVSRLFEYGIMWQMIPPLIFLCLGAMTDFGPMIANPRTLILGAAAQFGIFFAFFAALSTNLFMAEGFTIWEAAAIGIIGGAEGPTTIFVTSMLAPHIIGITAVACYSYMALVPIIQPPIIRLLTTKNERSIYMKPQLRSVSKTEKIVFPIIAGIIVILLVPMSASLIGMFMLGNLLNVCGVTERLSKTLQTAFIDLLTVFLTVSIGCTMVAQNFLQPKTLLVLVLGVIAFAVGTGAGVIMGKIMNLFSKDKINPMIGAAGVSAVPMAARVVQTMGQKENRKNYLLMHAMGPNVAGAIGAAIAGGIFLGMLG